LTLDCPGRYKLPQSHIEAGTAKKKVSGAALGNADPKQIRTRNADGKRPG
jgi:hypothetical protein